MLSWILFWFYVIDLDKTEPEFSLQINIAIHAYVYKWVDTASE